MLFIDFQKPFDTINGDWVWKSIIKQGIPIKIVNILKKVYEETDAFIKIDRPGPIFPITRRVKQGDPLSPNLFSCVLQEIFRKLQWNNRGVKIDGRYINNLRFADDIVLLSDNLEDVQKMGNELMLISREVGLHMNMAKTKYMTNVENEAGEIFIGVSKIEKVKEYFYIKADSHISMTRPYCDSAVSLICRL